MKGAAFLFELNSAQPLGEREVGVIVVSSVKNQPARDGHILDPAGIDLTNFRRNPICLYNHDCDSPVGTATAIGMVSGELAARIQFAPEGTSPLADQICSLTKAGVLASVSASFQPLESAPLNPKDPYGGKYISKAELYEISMVALPADTGARVVERSIGPRFRHVFAALKPVPRAAIERAAAKLPQCHGKPPLSPTMHCWVLQEQRRRDAREDYKRRQRELERRRVIGERY